MILASHNTMSYLPPKHWWLYPFAFMARCQSKSIVEQYEAGARLFDIRIAYDEYSRPHFRHGLMRYKGNVWPVFTYLNEMKDCQVRIVLEEYANDDNDFQESLFRDDIERWKEVYPHISFNCGVRKRDWANLCNLPSIEKQIKHEYASMQGGKLNDIWPWLYAKLHNAKCFKKYCDTESIVMMDFI